MERIDIKKETEGMTFAQYAKWHEEHAEQLKAQAEQDRLDRIEDKRNKMRLLASQFREIDGFIKYLIENTKQFDGKVYGDKLKDSITGVIREYVTEERCPFLLAPEDRWNNKNVHLGYSYSSLQIELRITRYGNFSIMYDYEKRNTVVNKIKGGLLDGELITEENVKKWTDGKIERVRDFRPSEYQGYYSNLTYFSYEGFIKSLRYTDGELLKEAEELEKDAERITEYMENLVQAMKVYNRALKDINHYASYILEVDRLQTISAPSELHYMGYSEDR